MVARKTSEASLGGLAALVLMLAAAVVESDGNAPAAEREQIENDIYVRIQNPDALRDEFVRRGVKLLRDIMDEPYGMRDFSIFGPEGCRLVFGAPMTGDDRN